MNVDDLLTDVRQDGFAIRRNVLGPEEVHAIRSELDPLLDATPLGRNPFEGFRTTRLYSPLSKTRVLDPLVLSPWIEKFADELIGPHTLSSIIGIRIGPGEVAQEIHYDAAAYPLPREFREVVFTTIWALDDFTVENGATVVYRGSHRSRETKPAPTDPPVQAIMPAGSVLIWAGKTFHGGGANRSDRSRLGLVIEFVAGWLRSHENVQASMPPALAGTLPQRMQELIGYHLYPEFLGFVDGRHPRKVLTRSTRAPEPRRA